MSRKPFTFRLTIPQIARLSLLSYLLTVAVLVAIRYLDGGWIGHGVVPAWAWAVGLFIPTLDLLLGFSLLQSSRRMSVARPPLFAGLILGLFTAYTLSTWR